MLVVFESPSASEDEGQLCLEALVGLGVPGVAASIGFWREEVGLSNVARRSARAVTAAGRFSADLAGAIC